NLPPSLGNGAVRAVVAVDRQEIHAAGRAFAADLFPSLVLLAAVLIIAAWIQVSIGLRPLDTVRQRLAQIRSGEATRLGSVFPDEVLPLGRRGGPPARRTGTGHRPGPHPRCGSRPWPQDAADRAGGRCQGAAGTR